MQQNGLDIILGINMMVLLHWHVKVTGALKAALG